MSSTIYDEIEIEDFDFDPEMKIFYYPCPCGDKFQISEDELIDGEEIAKCPSCSLMIRVVYDYDTFKLKKTDEDNVLTDPISAYNETRVNLLMRYSARLKTKESLSSVALKSKDCLNEEEIGNENDDYKESESEEDEEFNNFNEIPKKQNKKGRPKKLSQNINFQKFVHSESVNQEVLDENCRDSANELLQSRQIKLNKSNTRKKLKRAGRYLPPLEHSEIMGNLLSSKEEWKNYLNSENADIKRQNRKFKTAIIDDMIYIDANIKSQNFSSYIINTPLTTTDSYIFAEPIKFTHSESNISLSENTHYISRNTTVFNTGASVFSIRFCGCPICSESTNFGGYILIFSASSHKIILISAEIDKKNGIKNLQKIGSIVPPNSEMFTSICVFNSTLSITTEISHFFMNSQEFHKYDPIFECVLNRNSRLIPVQSCDISCHSWKGKHIVVGTLSGRIHVFNTELQEVFQTSLASKSAIYSIDWCNDFSFVIGGNFSKTYSIDLRDPFIIETEVSTLASLPLTIWSDALQSVIFGDGENHARRLEKSVNNSNRLHQPIGTYDTMVHAISASPNHNIIATACASGAIHLSWLPNEPGHGVEFEKQIFSIQATNSNENLEINSNPEYVQFQIHDTIKLYQKNQACTAVTWCPHVQFPGLLVGGFRNGLLVFLATDQFFI